MIDTQGQPLYDVAILGCGPIGATLAGLLARRGLRVVVIEQTTSVYPQPRAVGFDHDAMRLFQRIGVAEKLLPHIDSFRDTEYIGVDGQLIQRLRREQPPFALTWEPNYTCDQPGVETVLREHLATLAHVSLRFGHRVAAVTQDATTVQIHAVTEDQQPHRFTARYAVACDGASSPTREGLGLTLETYDYDVSWMVVDVQVHDDHVDQLPDSNRQYCEPARPCSYIVCPGNHRRWEFMVLEGEERELLVSQAYLWTLLGRWLQPGQAEILRAAPYQFHALVATQWNHGRVFLAGDSAHQTPPFLGQGMCQGLRDAGNLEWKLAAVIQRLAPPRLLDTYVQERKPNVIETTLIAKERGRLISERDEQAARERDAELLRTGEPVTLVRQELIPPLVDGLMAMGAPLAGRVFPQPRVVNAQGDGMLLDERFDGGFHLVFSEAPNREVLQALAEASWPLQWHALVVEQAPSQDPDPASIEAWSESGSLVRTFLNTHDCIGAVVRPDHYVFGAFRDIEEAMDLIIELKQTLALAPIHEAESSIADREATSDNRSGTSSILY